jgi:hypothetical protein
MFTEQSSVAVAANVAVPVAAPGRRVPYTKPGQFNTGGVISPLSTFTVNVQVAVRPEGSVAVAVTVVVPVLKILPEAGL